jgi:hypothetical protein
MLNGGQKSAAHPTKTDMLDSAAIFAKACFGHPSPSKRQK